MSKTPPEHLLDERNPRFKHPLNWVAQDALEAPNLHPFKAVGNVACPYGLRRENAHALLDGEDWISMNCGKA